MKLELKNVNKKYGNKEVIKNLNIVFEPGIYGFLGPNGAGKSTTIRMLCTVEKPVSGKIMYDDMDIFEMGGKFREKIGYVPQKAGYYPDFTASMFLKYIARLKDIADEKKIIEKCLKMVNLWDVKDKKIKEFSGGMKQRVNIAQALLNNPEILILDEPTVGLDPNERMNLKNLLTDLSEHKIIIFATHIVSDVEDIAKKVIILNQGIIRLNEYIEDAMSMAGDNIWECVLSDIDEIKRVKERYKISKAQRHKNGISLRIISNLKPCEGAVLVKGNLEEVYLRMIENKRV